MSNGAFDFDYEVDPNDDRLYKEDGRRGYPSITYHLGDARNKEPGFFTIDREAIEIPPGPFWEEDKVMFGNDPSALPSPVWKTSRLRAVFVEERTRQVVTIRAKERGQRDKRYYFNQFTKPYRRVDEFGNEIRGGHLSFGKQILFVFPEIGIPQPLALAANGLIKGTSWDNDPEGYHKENFPPGAKQQLLKYIADADEARGMVHPYNAAWLIDLVPLIQNGKPVWIESHNNYYNPFTIDLRTAGQFKKKEEAEGFPQIRFVTGELHHALKEFYSAKAVAWKEEWKSFDNTRDFDDSDNGNGNSQSQEVYGTEEDEIPF